VPDLRNKDHTSPYDIAYGDKKKQQEDRFEVERKMIMVDTGNLLQGNQLYLKIRKG
jgi:hypothetical protein